MSRLYFILYRSLLSLILLLLLFTNAVWALDCGSPRKEESDRTEAAAAGKADLTDGPVKEGPDPADDSTEEKADLSDDEDEETDTADAVTEKKTDIHDNPGIKESYPAKAATEEKRDLIVPPDKEESRPADAAIVRKAEFGVAIEWEEYKWKDGDRDQIFLLVPMYRPTKNLEFSVETPYVINRTTEESTRGVGDVTFAGNYVFLWDDYENDDPLLTLEGSIMFDTGSFRKGLGKGSNEYTLMPTVSKRVMESITVSGQVGYRIVTNGDEDSRRNYLPYGIAVDWTASDRIHVIAEFSSDQHPDITKPDQKVAELGLSYEILDWLTVSASFKKGVTRESPQWGMSFGLLIEYPGAD